MVEELQCAMGFFFVVAALFLIAAYSGFALTIRVVHMTYAEYVKEQKEADEEEEINNEEKNL